MNSSDEDDLVLRTLQSAFGQSVPIKMIEKSVGGDGLNATSEIVNVTVEYEQNNATHLKYLTLKIPAVKSPIFPIRVKLDIFRREKCMYEKVLPLINKLCITEISPIHYYTTDSNILVLENLAKQGYKCAPGNEFLSDEQFRPVLKTMAKFHAASLKVRQQHPHLLTDTIFEDKRLSAEVQPYNDEWIPVVCETLKRTDVSHLIPKAKAMLSTITHENGIKQRIRSENYNFVVLNHGDFRRENLLMKYNDDDEQLADVKIIDFQFCMWSTPVLDFLYCMVTSVQIDFVEENFDSFVNWYLQYLQETLLELGCNETYGKANFMDDFDKIKLSMNVAMMALCCILMTHTNRENRNDRNLPNQIPFGECLDDEDFVRIVSFWWKYFEKVGALDASYAEN